jgi:hypothetical protein
MKHSDIHNYSFVTGNISIPGRAIPLVSTSINFEDFIGAVRVRWGINRDTYRVIPGLYAVGNPGEDSDVFVTANYKLSFDALRKNLAGENGWILVLDTKGINVWCAAGKGTFGTKELVNRIRFTSLDKLVNHRRLILPQLAATGVAAHKVKEETGFNVHYGPVRASDIRKFISNGYRADKKMRRVTFGFFRDGFSLLLGRSDLEFYYQNHQCDGSMGNGLVTLTFYKSSGDRLFLLCINSFYTYCHNTVRSFINKEARK